MNNKVRVVFGTIHRVKPDRVIAAAMIVGVTWYIAIRVAALWYAMDGWGNEIANQRLAAETFMSSHDVVKPHPVFLAPQEFTLPALFTGSMWTAITFAWFGLVFYVFGARFSRYNFFVDKPLPEPVAEEETAASSTAGTNEGVLSYDAFTRTSQFDPCHKIDDVCYSHNHHSLNGSSP